MKVYPPMVGKNIDYRVIICRLRGVRTLGSRKSEKYSYPKNKSNTSDLMNQNYTPKYCKVAFKIALEWLFSYLSHIEYLLNVLFPS